MSVQRKECKQNRRPRALGTGPGRYGHDVPVPVRPGRLAQRTESSWKRRFVLEPQSTALFLLLMAAFGALVVWAVLAKQPVFRLLAACLAFIPAMLFGVAAVNKYYGYYETWAAVLADFTNRGVQNIPHVPSAGRNSARQFDHLLGRSINAQQAALGGAEIGLKVTGAKSRIARNLIIYLPPQYFQKQYATYRFPAIELIHGQPGEPQDWLAALDVQTTLQDLVAAHRAQPVVLVMPDVNGGRAISLQCLNQVGGAADDDFVALDVPDFVAARLRVQRPGRAWAIAGYSEGGYCAANLALRHPRRFGFAGVRPAQDAKPGDTASHHRRRRAQRGGLAEHDPADARMAVTAAGGGSGSGGVQGLREADRDELGGSCAKLGLIRSRDLS